MPRVPSRAAVAAVAAIACLLAGLLPAGPLLGGTAHAVERPLELDGPITDADLQGRSLRDLALMRNTIFARAGHTFVKPWLASYFAAQPWYQALPKAKEGTVSEVGWANAGRIATYEAGLKKAALVQMASELEARAKAGTPRPDDAIEARLLARRLGRPVVGAGGDAAPSTDPLENPSRLDQQLTKAELKGYSLRDLRILRNTVYARRGYGFKSQLLREWFEATSWYLAEADYTPKRLTRTDWRNIKLIKSLEEAQGGPLTDYAHMVEEGWLGGA